jgi:hypothetical protein
MPSLFDGDPVHTLILVAGAIGLAALAVALWLNLRIRARRYGGGFLAAAVMALAVAALLVSITPNAMPFDIGLFVLILSLLAIYRPEQVVKVTGGPSLSWRALREGRELQLLVRERGGPSLASRNPEVQDRYAALGSLEGPATEEYIGLLRETLLADPTAPGMTEKLERLAAADLALRASLGGRPTWEKELERRAAGEVPAE